MFDLTSDPIRRARRQTSLGSSAAAIVAHLLGLAVLLAIPVSRAVTMKPEMPSIQAFVVPPDLPLQPASPPPPPPPRAPTVQAGSAAEPSAAPAEAPLAIKPEADSAPLDATAGIEGGVAGGVVGGVLGGLVGEETPIPPIRQQLPARAATPRRIGGAVQRPDLLRRVEPVYSPLALASQIRGVVILEAIVDVKGSVESVKTLRSADPMLDKAAMDALKQWKYAPLVLAGEPTPFVVTVTFNFALMGSGQRSDQ